MRFKLMHGIAWIDPILGRESLLGLKGGIVDLFSQLSFKTCFNLEKPNLSRIFSQIVNSIAFVHLTVNRYVLYIVSFIRHIMTKYAE